MTIQMLCTMCIKYSARVCDDKRDQNAWSEEFDNPQWYFICFSQQTCYEHFERWEWAELFHEKRFHGKNHNTLDALHFHW